MIKKTVIFSLLSVCSIFCPPAQAAVGIRGSDIAQHTITVNNLAFTPIISTDTLQAGTTFYVSSGTVGSGGLTVLGPLSVQGSSVSSGTILAGNLQLTGWAVAGSSITAGAGFYGDGSKLSGVITSTSALQADINSRVLKAGDTMTGSLSVIPSAIGVMIQVSTIIPTIDTTHAYYGLYSVNGSANNNTPSGTARKATGIYGEGFGIASESGPSAVSVGVSGKATGYGTNYGLYGYASNGAPNYAAYLDGDMLSTGTVSAVSFIGDGSRLTGVVKTTGDTMTGQLTITSSVTTTGDAKFGGKVGINGIVPFYDLDVSGAARFTGQGIIGSSLTVSGEVGASAFKGSGAALTSLTAANISAGTAGIDITGNAATVTNGLYTTTSFAGDVTGTYNATVVGNDSHSHTSSTLTGVIYSTATGTYGISITGNAATATTTTGNAATATALAADPADCTLPNVALGINASGTAVCSQPSNITGNAATVTNGLYTTTSFSGDVTGNYNSTVVGNDSHTHSAGTLQNVVSTGTSFGGDVSGTYNAIAVTDDSHSHSASTLTGVIQSTATGTYAISTTGNAATATKLATARTINGVSFDGTANINIATTSYLADGTSLNLTGATFSANSSSVTLQGNTFNGANQLVKLDSLSKLPAVDGSQLTGLPSTPGGAVLASTQTFTGQNTFTQKVGYFSSPNGAYGVYIATTTAITGKLTTTVASDILDWVYSGYTSTFFGSHNGATSGDDGFGIYDHSYSWNGRLDLGLIYGPQLHGKGNPGAPLLGLNNGNPTVALDVTGGILASSSVTANGGFYGPFSRIDTALSTAAYLGNVQTFTAAQTMTGPLTLAGSSLTITTGMLKSGTVLTDGSDIGRFIAAEEITAHAHYGFLDVSSMSFTTPYTYGHASFDSAVTINGSADVDHNVGFQESGQYQGTGRITGMKGFTSQPTIVYPGTATYTMGYAAYTPTGTGLIDATYGFYADGSNTRGTLNYAFYSQGSAPSYLGGKLGIGIQAPSAALHVHSSPDANYGNLALDDSRTTAADVGGVATFAGYKTGTSAKGIFAKIKGLKENATSANEAGYLAFETNNNAAYVEGMRITSGQKIGIGTANPSTKLHVSSGTLTVDGTGARITTTGNVTATSAAFTLNTATSTFAGYIDMGLELVANSCTAAASCTATCPAGKYIISGGCFNLNKPSRASYPNTTTTWYCGLVSPDTDTISSYAYCARVVAATGY